MITGLKGCNPDVLQAAQPLSTPGKWESTVAVQCNKECCVSTRIVKGLHGEVLYCNKINLISICIKFRLLILTWFQSSMLLGTVLLRLSRYIQNLHLIYLKLILISLKNLNKWFETIRIKIELINIRFRCTFTCYFFTI